MAIERIGRKTAIAATMLLVMLSGCTSARDDLTGSAINRTSTSQDLQLEILDLQSGLAIYNQTKTVSPTAGGEGAMDLGRLLSDTGDYLVKATVGNSTDSREISWSRQTGPDRLLFTIQETGVEIQVIIV